MKQVISRSLISGMLLASACSVQALDKPVRHTAMVASQPVLVTSEGIDFAGKRIANGDFFHLRGLDLHDGSSVFGVMEGNTQELLLWTADAEQATPLWRGEIDSRVVEDICFYESTENQQLSAFLLGGRGGAEQVLLRQDNEWLAKPLVIRAMNVPYDATACAVDQQKQRLYIAEADQAIWSYAAEPEADDGRDLVAAKAPFGELQAEVKALVQLSDQRLLVLEEEPPRVLVYDLAKEQVTPEVITIDDVDELTDASLTADNQLLLTHDESGHSKTIDLALSEQPSDVTTSAVSQVEATLETAPSPRRGDAIDDPAVWSHPQDPNKSLILGTDKRTGLYVYDMHGKVVQELPVGRLNNVDVRGNLAVATLRDNNSLQLFTVDDSGKVAVDTNTLTDLDEIYGVCMGYNADTDATSIYVNGKSGRIQHYVVGANNALTKARELQVPSQPEGCVVDDKTQRLYVGEEGNAVWLFDARADATTQGEIIIREAEHPELVADIEGLALARVDGEVLLFVSSQGNNSYVVFDASAPYSLRQHFRVRTNPELGIDGSSETDGLEVTTQSLGQGFEQGALIVQDGRNRMPEEGQNFKLVPLQRILAKLQ